MRVDVRYWPRAAIRARGAMIDRGSEFLGGQPVRHTALTQLVGAYEQLEEELETRRFALWDELAKAEPELASEILQLFSTREAAARWVTSSTKPKCSPMRHAAEGRAAEVLVRVRRTAHGFGA